MTRHPTIVIKLGTSSIVEETSHEPLLVTLSVIVKTATTLRRNGYRVVIVSSGAIGIALYQMRLAKRPKALPQVQALAAIGQSRLMGLWDQLFDRIGQPVAQILLTRNDIADRTQYLNAQNTFAELLHMGVIPIVNENDTLSVSEINFGDNDTLSAITAAMVQADYLFLMTDVDCLYTKNPRHFADAQPIEVVENVAELEADVSSAGSALGTGGMSTKIVAARLATAAGVTTIITRSSKPDNISSIVRVLEAERAARRLSSTHINGQRHDSSTASAATTPGAEPASVALTDVPLHTRFLPSSKPIGDRRFWILHGLATHGIVYIDPGAARALADNAGLLPAGVIDAEGNFGQQECVKLVEAQRPNPGQQGTKSAASPSQDIDSSVREIGRAIVTYSAIEIKRIAGIKSTDIENVLGYADSEYIALRENIALLGAGERVSRPQTPTTSLAAGRIISVTQGDGGYAEG
ncbi:MAG: hypothetical protein M1828_005973 [Chrysothrix sp. TS-e1954]|nr:MAG: hypothetical protein M1828_005973 [Chrysothrix sp. TS-e1954]